jgi:hypothetical protein
LPTSPRAIGEQRGSTTSTLLTGAGSVGLCVGDGATRYGGVIDVLPAPTERGGIAVVVSASLPTEGGTGLLLGRVGPAVTSVEVHTADDRTVTATTSGGYFLAWWPSTAAADAVNALGPNGVVLGDLHGARLNRDEAPQPQQS